jgi:hypothetical protein
MVWFSAITILSKAAGANTLRTSFTLAKDIGLSCFFASSLIFAVFGKYSPTLFQMLKNTILTQAIQELASFSFGKFQRIF